MRLDGPGAGGSGGAADPSDDRLPGWEKYPVVPGPPVRLRVSTILSPFWTVKGRPRSGDGATNPGWKYEGIFRQMVRISSGKDALPRPGARVGVGVEGRVEDRRELGVCQVDWVRPHAAAPGPLHDPLKLGAFQANRAERRHAQPPAQVLEDHRCALRRRVVR